jgi:predicted nucleotidyltransferase
VVASLDLPDSVQAILAGWAERNDAVAELWIFGSRTKGTARPESDVDIGLVLMPPDGKTDWALGAFFALESEWKRELEVIAGLPVSLQAAVPDTKAESVVKSGLMLWKRPPA